TRAGLRLQNGHRVLAGGGECKGAMLPAGGLLGAGPAPPPARGARRARGPEAGREARGCGRGEIGGGWERRHRLPFQVHAMTRAEIARFLAVALRLTHIICAYCRGCSVFIAATSSFAPAPHRETDLIAWVKGTSRGCTRSRLRI